MIFLIWLKDAQRSSIFALLVEFLLFVFWYFCIVFNSNKVLSFLFERLQRNWVRCCKPSGLCDKFELFLVHLTVNHNQTFHPKDDSSNPSNRWYGNRMKSSNIWRKYLRSSLESCAPVSREMLFGWLFLHCVWTKKISGIKALQPKNITCYEGVPLDPVAWWWFDHSYIHFSRQLNQ